jgi:type IV pilus assembly protein PilA
MKLMKSKSKRGFTLVELMIVVAIIGVLAALAIYGVRRYLASSKTSEAKQGVGAISRGAINAYEQRIADGEMLAPGPATAGATHQLCQLSAGPTPAAPPTGMKWQPSSALNTGFQVPAWNCLRLEMTQPHYYSYSYFHQGSTGGLPTGISLPAGVSGDYYAAGAAGDLDGDGVVSGFALFGMVADSRVKTSTELTMANQFE